MCDFISGDKSQTFQIISPMIVKAIHKFLFHVTFSNYIILQQFKKNKIIPSKNKKSNQKTININILILANILNCSTDNDEWYLSKY